MTIFINPIKEFEKPELTEQFYIGTVIDNNDPAKLRRIRVRIVEIHGTSDNIPDELIPWSIQLRPTFLGGAPNLSTAAIPRIGSQVVVTHLKGEIYNPAYMFELYHQNVRDTKFDQNYPDSYGFQDSDSNFWHVDMVDDKLDILFNGTKCLEVTVDRSTIIGDIPTSVGFDDRTVGVDSTDVIGRDEIRDIGRNKTETVVDVHTENATRFIINTSNDTDINCTGNCTVDAANIIMQSGSEKMLSEKSINHVTGLPHGSGCATIFGNGGET